MSHKLGFALLAGFVSVGQLLGCGDQGDPGSPTTSSSTTAGSGGSSSGSGGGSSSSASTTSATSTTSSSATTSSASSTGGSAGAGGSAGTGGSGTGGTSDDGGPPGPDASNDASPPRDGGSDAGPAFDRNAIIDVMKRVAKNQLAEHPPQSAPNDWIYGAFYTGLMAAARTTKDPMIHDGAVTWSMAHNWDIHTGRMPPDPTHGDDQVCTQTYLELYLESPGPTNTFKYQKMQAVADSMIANPKAGRVVWWWCDALFMAPGVFARLGAATGQNKYFDFLNTMYWDSKTFLFDPAHGLFWRDKNYFNTNTFWSRGNGWVIAGIARVLEYLPMNDPKRADYVSLLSTMATALAPLQGSDGLWRADLLDATKFPMGEASGSGFHIFAMAWGVHHGVLSRDTYMPIIRKGWNGLLTLVAADGRMQFVQPTGAGPAAALQSDHLPYGAGAFLLAGSEVIEL